jgi:metal-responsive CopG/Arc/MetJ family transcriptional regulator
MNAEHHVDQEEVAVELPDDLVARMDELCRISAYEHRGELVADAIRTGSFDKE